MVCLSDSCARESSAVVYFLGRPAPIYRLSKALSGEVMTMTSHIGHFFDYEWRADFAFKLIPSSPLFPHLLPCLSSLSSSILLEIAMMTQAAVLALRTLAKRRESATLYRISGLRERIWIQKKRRPLILVISLHELSQSVNSDPKRKYLQG
jgi:hypothetical protein